MITDIEVLKFTNTMVLCCRMGPGAHGRTTGEVVYDVGALA